MNRTWRLPRLLRRRRTCPECGQKSPETYCKVCGYDLVRQTRDAQMRPPGV